MKKSDQKTPPPHDASPVDESKQTVFTPKTAGKPEYKVRVVTLPGMSDSAMKRAHDILNGVVEVDDVTRRVATHYQKEFGIGMELEQRLQTARNVVTALTDELTKKQGSLEALLKVIMSTDLELNHVGEGDGDDRTAKPADDPKTKP